MAWYANTSTGQELETGNELSLYPVPAGDDLFISHELKTSQPVDISVIDMTGKQVLHVEAQRLDESELRLDISSLSQGEISTELSGAIFCGSPSNALGNSGTPSICSA